MSLIKDLCDKVTIYFRKYAPSVQEETPQEHLDLQQYKHQYVAILNKEVIAHGTLEEVLQKIPEKEGYLPLVFYISPHLFEKNIRLIGF